MTTLRVWADVVAYEALLRPTATRPSGAGVGGAIIAVGSVLGAIAIGAIIVFLSVKAARGQDLRLHRGVSAARRDAVRKAGARAQATVVDVQFETLLGANDYVLEVPSPDGPARRVEVAEVMDLEMSECAFNGMTIAVFVDPKDPRVVVIDLDDLRQKAQDKKVQEKEKHARLLRGG
jgi:hypothetical protein